MRVIGLDVSRTLAEVAHLEDGIVRPGGRAGLRRESIQSIIGAIDIFLDIDCSCLSVIRRRVQRPRYGAEFTALPPCALRAETGRTVPTSAVAVISFLLLLDSLEAAKSRCWATEPPKRVKCSPRVALC